jgi:tetratricopeptide (TPR) repeat protein
LRDSESSLQSALASASETEQKFRELEERHMQPLPTEPEAHTSGRECHSQTGASVSHRLQHYKVLMDLLSGRCSALEERLESQAERQSSRDEETRRAFAALEDQAARLGAALVEQQRSSRTREDALRADLTEQYRSREDALRAELGEQYRAEVERLRRDASPAITGNVEEVGLGSSCSSSPKRSYNGLGLGAEHVHLSESWDYTRQVGTSNAPAHKEALVVSGDPCWHLHTEVPGLLSAGLPRSSAIVDQAPINSPSNSPRRQRASLGSPGSSPQVRQQSMESQARSQGSAVAVVTLTGEVYGPHQDAAQGRHLLETPASPQFGKFAADDSSQSSPRSPPTVRQQPSSAAQGINTTSGASASRPACDTSPVAGVGSASEQRATLEGSNGYGPDDVEAQLEELHTSLGATLDPKQAARLWARIGTLQQRRKCFNEARQAYATAVQLDGGTQHGSLANLAQLEAHAGNFPLARDLLERAVSIDPTNSAYRAFRQWLMKEGGLN